MQTTDQLSLNSEIDSPIVARKRTLAGSLLNVATGGGWGALKWVGRRFRGREGKGTWLGRVTAMVASHAIYSLLIGTIGIWGLLKGMAYVLAGVLALMGWETKPPAAEGEKAKNFIARAADAVDEKYDRLKEKLEAQAEERKRAWEEKEKEWKERDFAGQLSKRRHDADADIERRKDALAAKERELLAKAKDTVREHTPSPWELMFGSSGGGRSEPEMIVIGELYRIACPACGASFPFRAPETSSNVRVTCWDCGKDFDGKGSRPIAFTAEEVRADRDFLTIGKEDCVWFTCKRCNADTCTVYYENLGTVPLLKCDHCHRFNLVSNVRIIYLPARGRAERAELVRKGIAPPRGLLFNEYVLRDQYLKDRSERNSARMVVDGPHGPKPELPDLDTRTRWNDYQRSLPTSAIRQYLNASGEFVEKEDPSHLAIPKPPSFTAISKDAP